MFKDIRILRRHTGLVIHRQRPILEVDDFDRSGDGFAADLRYPRGDLRTNPPRPNATDDDKSLICVYHTRNIAAGGEAVKVQNTRNLEMLGSSIVDLISFLSSPQRDDALLDEAKVNIDRALFPLLVRLGKHGTLSVAELADQVGRDHTTVSRQLAKLESLDLIDRHESPTDRRRSAARLTGDGKEIVRAITLARRRLLSGALANWSEADAAALARLIRRFADTLIEFADAHA
jgi:DNA-binding MarR family transcriptional regulator